MEVDFITKIKRTGSLSIINCAEDTKKILKVKKKSESAENAVACIMTLFLPYLKDSLSDDSYNKLQQKLSSFLREYKTK